ncbi:NAD-dependent protein deacylase [Atopococcus tabaci]|uniref:NAD-dependent protein deacylase n=1 Tax=Atopococcus tabaci TaxID=269774 RepID=UPI0004232413|nr:NAD-dependent protein deacylase [Atopococcus tabaci]
MNQSIARLNEILEQSQNIVFFGGAGVSTESGIPDFRSSKGLYMQEVRGLVSPEEAVSGDFLRRYPKAFFDYYFNNLVYPEANPNVAHTFLADLEKQGKNVTVVTQNIDGLHQKAGSSRVLELHGTTLQNYCLKCGEPYRLEELQRDSEGIPRCAHDEGIVRPDVVLYGESLDQQTLVESIDALMKADMVIVAGTSLVVYPAAGLINYYEGDRLVLINKTAVTTSRKVDLAFERSISSVLSELDNYRKDID